MTRKPNNWYNMTYDEQREWERTQRQIEDAEYEARRAAEEAEQERSRLIHEKRKADERHAGEMEDMRQQEEYLLGKIRTLKDALTNLIEAAQDECNCFHNHEDPIVEHLRAAIERAAKVLDSRE